MLLILPTLVVFHKLNKARKDNHLLIPITLPIQHTIDNTTKPVLSVSVIFEKIGLNMLCKMLLLFFKYYYSVWYGSNTPLCVCGGGGMKGYKVPPWLFKFRHTFVTFSKNCRRNHFFLLLSLFRKKYLHSFSKFKNSPLKNNQTIIYKYL